MTQNSKLPGDGHDQDDVIVVSSARAQEILDCGPTKLYDLLKAGELESYLDGRARKITLRSIHARIHRLLQANRSAA
jgi:hypothetical protein